MRGAWQSLGDTATSMAGRGIGAGSGGQGVVGWPRSTAEKKLGRGGFQGEEEELTAREVLVNLLTADIIRSLVALAEGFCGMMGVRRCR